jgi:hypothetical protein
VQGGEARAEFEAKLKAELKYMLFAPVYASTEQLAKANQVSDQHQAAITELVAAQSLQKELKQQEHELSSELEGLLGQLQGKALATDPNTETVLKQIEHTQATHLVAATKLSAAEQQLHEETDKEAQVAIEDVQASVLVASFPGTSSATKLSKPHSKSGMLLKHWKGTHTHHRQYFELDDSSNKLRYFAGRNSACRCRGEIDLTKARLADASDEEVKAEVAAWEATVQKDWASTRQGKRGVPLPQEWKERHKQINKASFWHQLHLHVPCEDAKNTEHLTLILTAASVKEASEWREELQGRYQAKDKFAKKKVSETDSRRTFLAILEREAEHSMKEEKQAKVRYIVVKRAEDTLKDEILHDDESPDQAAPPVPEWIESPTALAELTAAVDVLEDECKEAGAELLNKSKVAQEAAAKKAVCELDIKDQTSPEFITLNGTSEGSVLFDFTVHCSSEPKAVEAIVVSPLVMDKGVTMTEHVVARIAKLAELEYTILSKPILFGRVDDVKVATSTAESSSQTDVRATVSIDADFDGFAFKRFEFALEMKAKLFMSNPPPLPPWEPEPFDEETLDEKTFDETVPQPESCSPVQVAPVIGSLIMRTGPASTSTEEREPGPKADTPRPSPAKVIQQQCKEEHEAKLDQVQQLTQDLAAATAEDNSLVVAQVERRIAKANAEHTATALKLAAATQHAESQQRHEAPSSTVDTPCAFVQRTPTATPTSSTERCKGHLVKHWKGTHTHHRQYFVLRDHGLTYYNEGMWASTSVPRGHIDLQFARLVDKTESDIAAEEQMFEEEMEARWHSTLAGMAGGRPSAAWKQTFRKLHHPDYHREVHIDLPVTSESAVCIFDQPGELGLKFNVERWEVIAVADEGAAASVHDVIGPDAEAVFQKQMAADWKKTLMGRFGSAPSARWKQQYARLHHPTPKAGMAAIQPGMFLATVNSEPIAGMSEQQVVTLTSQRPCRMGFTAEPPAPRRVMVLTADTAKEADEWRAALGKHIDDYVPTAQHAAVSPHLKKLPVLEAQAAHAERSAAEAKVRKVEAAQKLQAVQQEVEERKAAEHTAALAHLKAIREQREVISASDPSSADAEHACAAKVAETKAAHEVAKSSTEAALAKKEVVADEAHGATKNYRQIAQQAQAAAVEHAQATAAVESLVSPPPPPANTKLEMPSDETEFITINSLADGSVIVDCSIHCTSGDMTDHVVQRMSVLDSLTWTCGDAPVGYTIASGAINFVRVDTVQAVMTEAVAAATHKVEQDLSSGDLDAAEVDVQIVEKLASEASHTVTATVSIERDLVSLPSGSPAIAQFEARFKAELKHLIFMTIPEEQGNEHTATLLVAAEDHATAESWSVAARKVHQQAQAEEVAAHKELQALTEQLVTQEAAESPTAAATRASLDAAYAVHATATKKVTAARVLVEETDQAETEAQAEKYMAAVDVASRPTLSVPVDASGTLQGHLLKHWKGTHTHHRQFFELKADGLVYFDEADLAAHRHQTNECNPRGAINLGYARVLDQSETEIQEEETEFDKQMAAHWSSTLAGKFTSEPSEGWKAQYRSLHHPNFSRQIHVDIPQTCEVVATTFESKGSIGLDFDTSWKVVKIEEGSVAEATHQQQSDDRQAEFSREVESPEFQQQMHEHWTKTLAGRFGASPNLSWKTQYIRTHLQSRVAATQPLRCGLFLTSVNLQPIVGLKFNEVMELCKPRPCRLGFATTPSAPRRTIVLTADTVTEANIWRAAIEQHIEAYVPASQEAVNPRLRQLPTLEAAAQDAEHKAIETQANLRVARAAANATHVEVVSKKDAEHTAALAHLGAVREHSQVAASGSVEAQKVSAVKVAQTKDKYAQAQADADAAVSAEVSLRAEVDHAVATHQDAAAMSEAAAVVHAQSVVSAQVMADAQVGTPSDDAEFITINSVEKGSIMTDCTLHCGSNMELKDYVIHRLAVLESLGFSLVAARILSSHVYGVQTMSDEDEAGCKYDVNAKISLDRDFEGLGQAAGGANTPAQAIDRADFESRFTKELKVLLLMPVGTSPAAKRAEGSAAEALSVAESDHATASAALTQAKREEAIVEEQAASAGSELREVIAEQHRKEGSSAPESASAQVEMNAKVQTARVKLHATMQKLKAARSLTVSAEQAAHDTHARKQVTHVEATKTVTRMWVEHSEVKWSHDHQSQKRTGTLEKHWHGELGGYHAKYFVLDSDGLRYYDSKADANATNSSSSAHGYIDLLQSR